MMDWAAVSIFHFPLSYHRVNQDGTDGFFDAGMLLQALRAREEGLDDGDSSKPIQRREVGKKLRLSEY
jgi:hypothetical protein